MIPMFNQQFIQRAIQNNPNIRQNPQLMEYANILLSGDSQKGEALAKNLCRSMGISPEQGVQQGQELFKQMFGNNFN